MDKPTREQIEQAVSRLRYWLHPSRAHLLGDQCVPQIETLIAAMPEEPASDPRPADMAELAKLVAIELRKRGLYARAESHHVFPHYVDIGPHIYYMGKSDFDNLGPIGCADVLQAEEARRAREWAGDK